MIRNLNQMNFHDYGTVLSERPQANKHIEEVENSAVMDLKEREAQIYRIKTETWINSSRGKVILSASLDGKTFQHFYLDKPVCVKPNVFITLNSFMGDAAINYRTRKNADMVGTRTLEELAVPSRLQVKSIFLFFYEEREQGFLFPGESHPIPKLTYVDQGSLHVVVEGKDILLQQGDLILCGPDQWHMQYADIGVAPRFVTILFDLGGADITPLLNRKFTAPQHTVTLLQKMLREQEVMDPFSNDIIISHLNLLLLLLLREEAAPRAGKVQTSNAIHSENEIIRQAQQYVSTHIREKLSVPLVARHVDVSPSYLTALFHKNLQISPGEYIRRTKLQESKQMIRENNLNFTEIAAELQYSTVHHFSRQFKEKFGITPTEYAKSVR